MNEPETDDTVQGDELSNHYSKVEFDCCGHPSLDSDKPICLNCGYQWYDELYDVVNRSVRTEIDQ